MKLRPNIYFVPWPSGSFSFSASFVVGPSAKGCDAEVATSVKEGTLSEGGISFMVVEVVWAFLWDLGGWSLTRVGWARAAVLEEDEANACTLMVGG